MTRDELLSYDAEDINKMTKEELYQLAKAEQKNIKDAMRRLRLNKLDTPALKRYEAAGNVSAKKSMSRNELLHQVMKGQTMLRYKTGTVSEAKKFQKSVRHSLLTSLEGRLDADISPTASKNLWKVISKLTQEAPGLINAPDLKYVPKEAQQKVYDVMKNNELLNKELTQEEEEQLYSQTFDSLVEDYEKADDFDEEDLYGFDI